MPRDASYSALLWIVAAGFFMQTLDTTIVNTALPSIANDFGVPALELKPVVVVYMLTMAILMPASGWLSDRYGSRNVYFSAILAFVLGSLFCALAASPTQLVIARVLQGMGASMLIPVGRLAVLRAVKAEDFISALAFISIAGQVGPIFGPTLGGLFVQTLSWHWIFLINVPIGLVGLFACWRYLPRQDNQDTPAFDFFGCALLAVCLVSFSTALDIPAATNKATWAAGLGGLSALSASLYVWHARRCVNPLFSLRLFSEINYTVGLIGNMVGRIGSAAVPFLMPLVMQLHLDYSPLHAGMMMLPVAIAGAAAKPWIAPLIKRFGYRQFLITNTIIVGLWIVSFAAFSPDWPLALEIIQLAGFGAFNSMQYSAMNSVTLTAVDKRDAGAGNSLFSMIQMIAIGLGVTVGGGLVSVFSGASHNLGPAFAWSFVCVGSITALSALVFRHLDVARLHAGRGRTAAAVPR